MQVMALPGRQKGRQTAVASAIRHGLSYLCSLVLRRTASGSARYTIFPCSATSFCTTWPGLPRAVTSMQLLACAVTLVTLSSRVEHTEELCMQDVWS